MEAARRVICAPLPATQAGFSEEQGAELRDRVFDEFNSLSVVFNAPSSSFLDDQVIAQKPRTPFKTVDHSDRSVLRSVTRLVCTPATGCGFGGQAIRRDS